MSIFRSVSIVLFLTLPAVADNPFAIEVVDAETGRGVPLIELRTVNDIRYVTDSAGLVAFDEPGLMHESVFFHFSGHGYEFPKDGFGFRGKALHVVQGGKAKIEVHRINVAQRLYRVTGAGIYRDTRLLDRPSPIRDPVINAQVMGSDSVLNAVFQGKIHWFWGDTNRPGYPLGNYQTPTATSRLPGDGGIDPEVGIDLDYAIDGNGFAAPSAKMPGDGPTWLDGLTVIKDQAGKERMFAAYAKIRPPLETYERGLIEFDPETRTFHKVAPIPLDAPIRPFGHPFPYAVGSIAYVYFGDPYAIVRVRADVQDVMALDRYEAFTCLLPTSRPGHPEIDRDSDGSPRYLWRRGAPPLDAETQARLVKSGAIQEADALFPLRDVESGRSIVAHRGSIAWNPYRKRWLMIATEIGGTTSNLGEVWFAEADRPLGPWVYARKVVTHDKYSFYNPKQDPMLAKDGGRLIFFEGTYTTSFSGNPVATPRYDYNQVMYKLDLDDPRLNLPVPFDDQGRRFDPNDKAARIAFYALERPRSGMVAVGEFHAGPIEGKIGPGMTILHQRTKDGRPTFSTEDAATGIDGSRALGRVWRNPSRRTISTE